MYVLIDFEWIQYEKYVKATQLAAVRVDKNWDTLSEFSGIFEHSKVSTSERFHVAYTGISTTDIINGEEKEDLIQRFFNWLQNDDILLFWHYETKLAFINKFEEMVPDFKNFLMHHLRVSIKEDYGFSASNPYKIAKELDLDVDFSLCHNAVYDLFINQKVLKVIIPDQSSLLDSLEKYKDISYPIDKKNPTPQPARNTGYVYNSKTKELHKKNCSKLIIDSNSVKYKARAISHLITLECKLCGCCREEYLSKTKEYNEKILNNSQYNYFFGKYNKVFHTKDCHHALSVKNIMAVGNYKVAIKYGKRPCKLCNPTIDKKVIIQSTPKKKAASTSTIKKEETKKKTSIYKLEPLSRAVILKERAEKDRKRMLSANNLSSQQKKDINTLTRTSFAFWAGKGFQTFHCKNCSKLNSISDIQGFRTYEEAIAMGYKPCKQCKPKAKYNVSVAIPLDSNAKAHETIDSAINFCKLKKIDHYLDDKKLCIETKVGRWKIHYEKSPYMIEHINLALNPNETEFHLQRVAFYSIIEAIEYIIKHDKRLEIEVQTGTIKRSHIVIPQNQ